MRFGGAAAVLIAAGLASACATHRDCEVVVNDLPNNDCLQIEAARERATSEAELAKRVASWTIAERTAFVPLKKAHDAYVEAHGENEGGLANTWRFSGTVTAEEQARSDFVDKLEKLSAEALPKLDAKAEDLKLDAAYRVALATFSSEEREVFQMDVREAQRAWLNYRDAFVTFAKVKAPNVPSEAVRAWLTSTRTQVLRDWIGPQP